MIYEKLPVIFLTLIATEKRDTTNAQIASTILSHLDEFQNMSIKDLAKACLVAPSSISRFCKEIGLQDFADLKELLQKSSLDSEPLINRSDYLLPAYEEAVVSGIHQCAASLDIRLVDELCQDIYRYKKVAIFGLLKAGGAALSLQTDLLMLQKKAYFNMNYAQQIDYLLTAGKEDLILIFSYTGSYFDYPNFRAEERKLKDPRIWMITGSVKEKPWFVNKVLHFDSRLDLESHPYQLEFIAGIIAREYNRFLLKKRN